MPQRDQDGAVPTPNRGPTRGGDGKFVPRLDTAERDAKAVEMRTRGATFREIAEALGYTDGSTASRAVQRALSAVRTEGVAELRAGEDAHLMTLRSAAWAVLDDPGPVVSEGRIIKGADGEPLEDRDKVLKAIDRLVRIAERRSKLWGLDSPQRHKIETGSPLDDEIVRLATEIDQRAREDERRKLTGG